jgi:Na+/H+-dicarboxylate symporter
VLSLVVAGQVFARVPAADASVRALGSSLSTSPDTQAGPVTTTQWLLELVPPNILRAAVDGAVLPVVLFSALFGLAVARANRDRRDTLLPVVEAVADAMQHVVAWVLALAPIGVFALAVPLAARLGWSAAGAVATYVVLVVILTTVLTGSLLYPLGILAGRMTPSAFISYCAAPQALAFASRSSLATLPAMLESAERVGLSAGACRLVLPVALSVFHFGAAIAQTVGVVFLAHLFDVTLTMPQLASLVVAVVFASIAVPGIPGGSIIAMTPVLQAAHVPLEGIGILLAVDTIPDMFRTTANVTGALTLAATMPAEQQGHPR